MLFVYVGIAAGFLLGEQGISSGLDGRKVVARSEFFGGRSIFLRGQRVPPLAELQ